MSKRDFLIDNSKGLLIFLVVFGHALEFIREDSVIARVIYIFIYQFHMPVFVFISGYLSKNIIKGRNEAVKKFLIPFLLFNIIWNSLQLISKFFSIAPNVATEDVAVWSFFKPGWALWYILALFIWKILLPDLLKLKYLFAISIFTGLTCGLFTEFNNYLSLSRIIAFTPFFIGGYYMSQDRLKSYKKKSKFLSLFIIFAAIAISILFVKLNVPDKIFWADRPYALLKINMVTGIVCRLIIYIISFAFIFVFANLMTDKKTFLCKIGTNTLSVYLLHTYLLGLILVLCNLAPTPFTKISVCIVGSIIITFLLSRDIVASKLNSFINYVTKKIPVKGGKK